MKSDISDEPIWITAVELLCWRCLKVIDVGETVRWNPDSGRPIHACHGRA